MTEAGLSRRGVSRAGLPSLAWRNIWRNSRRTLITLAGIAFGVTLAVIYNAIGDASYSDMIDHAARLGNGHVVLQHPDFIEQPTLAKTVIVDSALEDRLHRDPRVVGVVRRISGAVMVATAHNSTGAAFIAVDPQENNRTFALARNIVEGEMFKTPQDKGIILGKDLAETLGASLGNKIVYTLTDKHGEVVSALARLSGIIETGAPTVDGGLVLLPLKTLADRLDYAPNEVTQVAVFLHDNRQSASLARDFGALTWYEVQPELASFIALKRSGSVVMQVIIMLMLAAGIFNTLLMSVLERQREFGVMMALGFSAPQIFGLVVWECVWVALSGLVAAALLCAGPYAYLHAHGIDSTKIIAKGSEVSGVAFDPIMRVSIYSNHLLEVGLAVVIATLLAGLYPAWRAGRAQPAEVIRIV